MAVCIFRLLMIDSSLCTPEIQDKFFSDIIFPRQKKSFSQIFSRTVFCLGLHTAVVFRMQSFNIYLNL